MVSEMEPVMEPEETGPPAKRGRPSKCGPLYMDGMEVLSADKRERLNELAAAIKSDGEKLHKLMAKTAGRFFEMGQLLDGSLVKLKGLPTLAKLEKASGISARTCSTALKVYRHFKDAPHLLESLTMRDVAALISPPKEREGRDSGGVPPSLPPGQLEFCHDSFGLPTASGVNLDKYRVADGGGGRLYLIRRGVDIPVPVVQVTMNPPDGEDAVLTAAWREFSHATQCAVERYLAVLESTEEEE